MPGKNPHITSKTNMSTGRLGLDLSFRQHRGQPSPSCQPESHLPDSPYHPNRPIWAPRSRGDDENDGNDDGNTKGKAQVGFVETTKDHDNVSISSKLVAIPDLKQAQALICELLNRSANQDVVCRMMTIPHHRRRPKEIARHPHERPGIKEGSGKGWRAHHQPGGRRERRQPRGSGGRQQSRNGSEELQPSPQEPETQSAGVSNAGCNSGTVMRKTKRDDRDDGGGSAPATKSVRTNSSHHSFSKEDLGGQDEKVSKRTLNIDSDPAAATAGTPSTDACAEQTRTTTTKTTSAKERTRSKERQRVCAYGIPVPCPTCMELGLSDSVPGRSKFLNGTKRSHPECLEGY